MYLLRVFRFRQLLLFKDANHNYLWTRLIEKL
nr:MAG TPA: hypothetical protein [Caudoviricetes sp.]